MLLVSWGGGSLLRCGIGKNFLPYESNAHGPESQPTTADVDPETG